MGKIIDLGGAAVSGGSVDTSTLAKEAKQDTLNTKIDSLTTTVNGIKLTSNEFARPADVLPYVAGDVIGTSASAATVQYLAIGSAGQGGVITKLKLMCSQSGLTNQFRIHFYRLAPTAINDNAAFVSLYANKDKGEGSIVMPAMSANAGSDCSACFILAPNFTFKLGGVNGNLPYVIETLGAYTPTSGATFYLEAESTILV